MEIKGCRITQKEGLNIGIKTVKAIACLNIKIETFFSSQKLYTGSEKSGSNLKRLRAGFVKHTPYVLTSFKNVLLTLEPRIIHSIAENLLVVLRNAEFAV